MVRQSVPPLQSLDSSKLQMAEPALRNRLLLIKSGQCMIYNLAPSSSLSPPVLLAQPQLLSLYSNGYVTLSHNGCNRLSSPNWLWRHDTVRGGDKTHGPFHRHKRTVAKHEPEKICLSGKVSASIHAWDLSYKMVVYFRCSNSIFCTKTWNAIHCC